MTNNNKTWNKFKTHTYGMNIEEGRAFSIRFKSEKKSLNILAGSVKLARIWANGIQRHIKLESQLSSEERHHTWLRLQFELADTDNSGVLEPEQAVRFFNSINLDTNQHHIKRGLHTIFHTLYQFFCSIGQIIVIARVQIISYKFIKNS